MKFAITVQLAFLHQFLSCTAFHVGFLVPFNESDKANTNKYAHAFTIAIDDVNNDPDILPGHKLTYNWSDTTEPITGLRAMIGEHINGTNGFRRPDVFIGPADHCVAPARVSQAFGIPMISYYCTENTRFTKQEYPLFIRTYANANKQTTEALFAVLQKMNWTRIGIIYEDDEKWKKLKEAILRHPPEESRSHKVVAEESVPKDDQYDYLTSIRGVANWQQRNSSLKKTREALLRMDKDKQVKIFVILASDNVLMDIMAEAYNIGLAGRAQIPNRVFIGFQLEAHRRRVSFKTHKERFYNARLPSRPPSIEPERRVLTKNGARSLLLISVKTPNNTLDYNRFDKELTNRTCRQEPFNSTDAYGCHGKTVRVIIDKAPALYDAVYQYGRTMDRLLKKNASTDARTVVEEFRSEEYDSISGFAYSFNQSDGNLKVHLELLHLEEKTTIHNFNTTTATALGEISYEDSEPKLVFYNGSEVINWPWGTKNPIDTMNCENDGFDCPPDRHKNKSNSGDALLFTIPAIVIGFLVIIFLVLIFFVVRQRRRERELKRSIWEIDINDIIFERKLSTESKLSSDSGVRLLPDIDYDVFSTIDRKRNSRSSNILQGLLEEPNESMPLRPFIQTHQLRGSYKNERVFVKILPKNLEISRSLRKELLMLCRIKHENLNPFVGLGFETSYLWIVMQYGTKGTLEEVIANKDVKLNYSFVLSLVYDIAKGMTFLHNSDIRSHGNLKSSNCIVDNRWVLKITDYGLSEIRSRQLRYTNTDTEERKFADLFWKAPELLRQTAAPLCGTQKGDVYSFSIILEEFHTLKSPYSKSDLSPKRIIERVADGEIPPYRPVVVQPIEDAESLLELMKNCWQETPEKRPTFHEIRNFVECAMIRSGLKTDICDNMIMLLEQHSNNLEHVVYQKTRELREEKYKTEALLDRMLPRSVADQLKKGENVEAECFSSVTIYFSDIVQFTALCAESTPMQVVDFLNDLYSLFDDIIMDYHVYKVETIGDAYMVVSGLPTRNGKLHASEIACMALEILENVSSFRIRHKPEHRLQIRIGMHTGPAVAGVVGMTMPRYCLFGDTVNTASRMESNGEALRIHISESTKCLLDELGGFDLEQRPEQVYLKGKGHCTTYWLNGASPDVPRCPRKLSKKAMKPLFQKAATRKFSAPFRVRKKTQPFVPRFSVA